jgi:hypothetical protein
MQSENSSCQDESKKAGFVLPLRAIPAAPRFDSLLSVKNNILVDRLGGEVNAIQKGSKNL